MQPKYSSNYKTYILLILTGVYTFNFVDRYLLSILQESIKADLGLSDTQLGLMTGLAFAIFYVTMGLPIARYADSHNRRNVIAVSLSVWSVMTAISGFAANFWQLLLARIGVGVGEAGGTPPAHSIISDYFEIDKRARAFAIYSMGIYFGIFVGNLLGGWLDELYGWRMAFILIGIPGVLFALLVRFTVKEPERGRTDVNKETATQKLSTKQVFKILLKKRTFVLIALASGFQTFSNYGVGNWHPPFLSRLHGMEAGEIGTTLAITAGLGGALGTFLGGYFADKWSKKDKRWYIWVPALMCVINIIPALGVFFLEDTKIVIALIGVTSILAATFIAPVLAATQSLVGSNMRAITSAVLYFVMNLIGLGLGPFAVGYLSDILAPSMGIESLRYALLITLVSVVIAIVLYWQAAKSYEKDLAEV